MSQTIKDHNQISVLDAIRVNKAISSIELSTKTELPPDVIQACVSSLLEQNYICEKSTDEEDNILYALKPKSFYTIGVELDYKHINIVLMDYIGEIICTRTFSMPVPSIFQYVVAKIQKVITEMLESYSIGFNSVLGLGICVPGMVDANTQEIVLVPNLDWRNINFKGDFIRLFNIPVYVENDAMAAAICENWIGSCQNVSNFVCIHIKDGIGSGIFINGKPYRGGCGTAGEVGHIVVDENGPRCGCGNHGCVGTFASTSRIVEKVKRMLRQGAVSKISKLKDIETIEMDHIIVAAKNGDELCKNALVDSAKYLASAISIIVNILNPEKVVLGREFAKYSDLVIENVRSIVYQKALKYSAANVQITLSTAGEQSALLGAAIIPLRVLFRK